MSSINEKIENLINAYKEGPDAEDDLNFIEKSLGYFVNYVNSVVMMEYKMPLLRARFDGQDLRDSIEELDSRRRSAHECAISSCRWLNKLSAEKGLEAFYPGDLNDRYAIADFIGNAVMDFYKDAINRSRYKDLHDLAEDGVIFNKITLDDVIEKCKHDNETTVGASNNNIESQR